MRTSLHNPFMPVTGLSDTVAYNITQELRGGGRGEYNVFVYNGKEYRNKGDAEKAMRAATTPTASTPTPTRTAPTPTAPTPTPTRTPTATATAPTKPLDKYDVEGTGWAADVKKLFDTPEAIPEDLSDWSVTGGRGNYSLEFNDGTKIPLTISKYDDEHGRIQSLVDNLGLARSDYQEVQSRIPSDTDDGSVPPERPDPVPPPTTSVDDTSDLDGPPVSRVRVPPTLTDEDRRVADLEDAYDYTKTKLDEAEAAYSGLQSTYTTTMEEMGKLQTDFDSLFSDYSALGTDKSSLQGTYDDMIGQYTSLEGTLATTREQMAEKNRLYIETAASLSDLQGDFAGLQGDYTGLQGDFAGLQGDYTGLQGDYSGLQGDFAGLQGDYSGLQGDYTGLQGDYSGLQGDFAGLQGSFDDLQADYGLTSEQLAKALEDAAGLRQSREDTQTQNFLQGAEADKMRRMATATGGIGSLAPAPAQAQYTQARDAMQQTALNPMSYNMDPIDFTGGMDNNIFTPTQFSAPGADAAVGYTDIFSGPSMGLTQYGYDYGSNFNPYFDALNEQYGIPTAGVKQ